MQIVQIVAAIISILLGASQVAKEVAPLIPGKSQPQYVFRGEDAHYRYWSDASGRYWCRMDRQGQVQYAENPEMTRIASNPLAVR
jgi:hypothetical protein